jgi:hypothetical protein
MTATDRRPQWSIDTDVVVAGAGGGGAEVATQNPN